MRYCTCGHPENYHLMAHPPSPCSQAVCGCESFTFDALSAKIDAARAKRRREDRAWKAALKKLEAER